MNAITGKLSDLLSSQSDPPVAVHDLFTDIQDGRILMALLEELSGCKLVRSMMPREVQNTVQLSKCLWCVSVQFINFAPYF